MMSVPNRSPQEELQERFAQSIDVSGTFDNCFFHCYATHLLANNLPLPHDLFTFHSILGENSHATQLQALIPDQEALTIFSDYEKFRNPNTPSPFPHYLVEKTLALGCLLREWFATKLLEDINHQNSMLTGNNNIPTAFASFKGFREAGIPKETLLQESSLYEANIAFLDYFSARMGPQESAHLSETEQRFERYFTEANEDIDAAIKAYWLAEGYKTYCQHIAHLQVKLSPSDVMPVIKTLGQSTTLYARNGGISAQNDGNPDIPPLEIVLTAEEGHYRLLKTGVTAPLLEEYKNSYAGYLHDREAVLASSGDKLTTAHRQPSLLVSAICPSGNHVPWVPFDSMVERLRAMKQVVVPSIIAPSEEKPVQKPLENKEDITTLVRATTKSLLSSDQSVNVSGTFSNCFFHCYALHLLTNDLALPEDLFTFKSLLGTDSPATQLQAQFPNKEALNLFANYEKKRYPKKQDKFPSHLVEKTLVLGCLLREWFAKKLVEDKAQKLHLLTGDDNVVTLFKNYKSFRQGGIPGELLTQQASMEANVDFLDYFSARTGPKRDLNRLSDRERRFENYFTASGEDIDTAIKAYWLTEGYKSYCHHVAQLHVSLSSVDVLPVMNALHHPMVIYPVNENALAQPSCDLTMALLLAGEEGHYHLLKTKKTAESLQEYQAHFSQYLKDREVIEKTGGNKLALCQQKPSLLLSAILHNAPRNPLDCMVSKITEMKQFITQPTDLNAPTQKADTNNYHFLLKLGASLSAIIAVAALVVAILALFSIVTATTGGVALGVGIVAGVAAYGFFKTSRPATAPEKTKELDQSPSPRNAT